ncbi:MAG TPA: amidohydrolase [Lentisphaeria bacterium]|nr:MAG: hypothetical protein A2X47_08210 [Lentisphaerae bacterium GWF2_38_69]HBM16389.1 amidohydrolase [Lentisphaeria bacterium]
MVVTTKENLELIVNKYLPKIIEIRYYIHSHPEISYKEFKTAQYIREILKAHNLEILAPFLGTDTVAFLNRNIEGKNVTLRADIDALPILEEGRCVYKSENEGVMHACGHDGHTAMLLGAAMVLSELKGFLNGSVRFVFQPAEEGLCGGKDLVNAGALKNPEPNVIFGFHGWPGVKIGHFASKPGPITSACDTYTIRIFGKGAHSSTPEHAVDPILISAKIIEAFKSISTNSFSPLESVLVSVCRIQSGTASNIIPDTAEMEGSVRYFNPSHGQKIEKRMKKMIRSICKMYGAAFEFKYDFLYIPTVNNRTAVEFAEKVTHKYFGKSSWETKDRPVMGSEDFSFFIKGYPGAFINVGLGENSPGLHTSAFDFNDESLKYGVTMFCALALEYLG